jgi:hypothetical protein
VPAIVRFVFVAMGPAAAEIDVSVGTGGLVTLKVRAFEVGVTAVGQLAVMLTDSTVVSNDAGIAAKRL